VWSCLAAHAAVLRLDGIDRQRLPGKLSGVFECARGADHPIAANAGFPWRMPHSRYNGLDEAALLAAGYRILSRSPSVGVDMFVKPGKSLFLFVQGHPEYDPGALFREYRRDVGRFLAGVREGYPETPYGAFEAAGAAAFARFRERAVQHRSRDLLASFPAMPAADGSQSPWRDSAVCVYANWLEYLAQGKSRRRGAMPGRFARGLLKTTG
jgi:homoserine O-succinyltransferase